MPAKRKAFWRVFRFLSGLKNLEEEMPGSKRLIIGLGNPGAEYEYTRHNIGFQVVESLAKLAGISLAREKGDLVAGWGKYRNTSIGLAKPQAFMNRSGASVKALLNRYQLAPSEILVVVDDINLETGKIRIREKGSAGGHNGIQDIIETLHSSDFPRIRIGIGNNFPRGRQSEYVLSPFSEEELPLIKPVIESAAMAALTFARDGIVTAMNRYN